MALLDNRSYYEIDLDLKDLKSIFFSYNSKFDIIHEVIIYFIKFTNFNINILNEKSRTKSSIISIIEIIVFTFSLLKNKLLIISKEKTQDLAIIFNKYFTIASTINSFFHSIFNTTLTNSKDLASNNSTKSLSIIKDTNNETEIKGLLKEKKEINSINKEILQDIFESNNYLRSLIDFINMGLIETKIISNFNSYFTEERFYDKVLNKIVFFKFILSVLDLLLNTMVESVSIY